MRIHDYRTHNDLKSLEKIVDNNDPSESEDLMKALYPVRDKPIGKLLDKIIKRFSNSAKYDTPMDWFNPTSYKTFMEYFKRSISKPKLEELQSNIASFDMVMPCEANIEAIGDFTDSTPILRLKKTTNDVLKDLAAVGINPLTNEFISFKLLKCFYHRIHSPVDGTIEDIKFIGKENPLFNNNSLWIVSIASEHGMVYMLLVGELSIQDFTFVLKKGDKIKKLEELGNFNWGSQVVIIFEKDLFNGDILINQKEKYFVGEGIFSFKERLDVQDLEDMPNTQIARDQPAYGVTIAAGDTGTTAL